MMRFSTSGVKYGIAIPLGFVAFAVGYAIAVFGPDAEYELRSRLIEYEAQELTEEDKLDRNFQDEMLMRVWPSQIDRNGHVNNASFIRSLNFSRKAFFLKMGVWALMRTQRRNMVVQAQTIRYRKELSGLFRQYRIQTKIVGYSDTGSVFYVESRFIDEDSFILAVHHCKYKIIRRKDCSPSFEGPRKPSEILRHIGMESISILNADEKGNNPFIDRWSEANEYSSRELNPR